MSRGGWVLLAVALPALAPPAAAAAGLSVRSGTLVYAAAAGERNDVTFFPEGDGSFRVVDATAEVRPGDGCAAVLEVGTTLSGSHRCTGVTAALEADLGDQDDRLMLESDSTVPVVVAGGPGADSVSGGAEHDRFSGGPGTDELFGGGGGDVLAGDDGDDWLVGDGVPFAVDGELDQPPSPLEGADRIDAGDGDDRIDPGRGDDTVQGGPGVDEIQYGGRSKAVSVILYGDSWGGEEGERDALSAIEAVVTGGGADTVQAGDGVQRIATGGGGDDIDPGPGADAVDAGDGADVLRVRDGAADRVECGAGEDSARLDPADEPRSCEVRDYPPAADTSAIALSDLRAAPWRGTRGVIVRGRLRPAPGTGCSGALVQVRAGRARVSRRLGAGCRFTVTLRARFKRLPRRVTVSVRSGTRPARSITRRPPVRRASP